MLLTILALATSLAVFLIAIRRPWLAWICCVPILMVPWAARGGSAEPFFWTAALLYVSAAVLPAFPPWKRSLFETTSSGWLFASFRAERAVLAARPERDLPPAESLPPEVPFPSGTAPLAIAPLEPLVERPSAVPGDGEPLTPTRPAEMSDTSLFSGGGWFEDELDAVLCIFDEIEEADPQATQEAAEPAAEPIEAERAAEPAEEFLELPAAPLSTVSAAVNELELADEPAEAEAEDESQTNVFELDAEAPELDPQEIWSTYEDAAEDSAEDPAEGPQPISELLPPIEIEPESALDAPESEPEWEPEPAAASHAASAPFLPFEEPQLDALRAELSARLDAIAREAMAHEELEEIAPAVHAMQAELDWDGTSDSADYDDEPAALRASEELLEAEYETTFYYGSDPRAECTHAQVEDPGREPEAVDAPLAEAPAQPETEPAPIADSGIECGPAFIADVAEAPHAPVIEVGELPRAESIEQRPAATAPAPLAWRPHALLGQPAIDREAAANTPSEAVAQTPETVAHATVAVAPDALESRARRASNLRWNPQLLGLPAIDAAPAEAAAELEAGATAPIADAAPSPAPPAYPQPIELDVDQAPAALPKQEPAPRPDESRPSGGSAHGGTSLSELFRSKPTRREPSQPVADELPSEPLQDPLEAALEQAQASAQSMTRDLATPHGLQPGAASPLALAPAPAPPKAKTKTTAKRTGKASASGAVEAPEVEARPPSLAALERLRLSASRAARLDLLEDLFGRPSAIDSRALDASARALVGDLRVDDLEALLRSAPRDFTDLERLLAGARARTFRNGDSKGGAPA